MTFKSFKGHIYVRVQPILSGNQPRASLCFLRDPVNDALHGLSIKGDEHEHMGSIYISIEPCLASINSHQKSTICQNFEQRLSLTVLYWR